MPILANLSRRFHMLTTDARPDPPRIDIPDNSCLNDSSTNSLNEITSVPRDIENASSIDNSTNLRIVQNNLSDSGTNNSNSEKNTGKKSNSHSKKKTQSGQAKNVINYNIVHSNGVKIGETITYVCNINQYGNNEKKTAHDKNNFTSTKPMTESVKILSLSKNELTMQDMFLIKTHMDNSWREIFKSLGYSKGQLDQFEESYKSKGINEMIYQILLDWKRENGKEAHIGSIVKILWEHHQYDCVAKLIDANNKS